MARASALFNPEETRRVESAVADAEKRTAAEIVPAVATASGRYDRAEDIVGLWLGLIAMAVVWFLIETPGEQPGDWGEPAGTWPLLWLGSAVVGGLVVGAYLAQFIDPLRRILIPRSHRDTEVREAALQLFHDSRVHHTQAGCGVLIYVSLFERQAAVIADRAVIDLLGQAAIDELCAELVQRLRKDNPADALCAVIHEAGNRLEKVLPRQGDDVNELEDALVLVN